MKYSEIEAKVRYSECDAMGIVHHRNYFTWFEMGRFHLLKEVGIDYIELERQKILFPVIKAECVYRKPAHFDETIIICTQYIPQKIARLDFKYKIYEKKSHDVLVTGKTSQAITVLGQGMVLHTPNEIITKLNKYMEQF